MKVLKTKKPENQTICRLLTLDDFMVVIPAGFEPTTHSLEGCCSIQLSYETILFIAVQR